MDSVAGMAGGLLDWAQAQSGLPNMVFFHEINSFLDDEISEYAGNLLGRTLALVGAAVLSLLTLWILIQGYRIVTGQSRESLMGLVVNSLKAVLIIGIATGAAAGAGSIYGALGNGLPEVVNEVMTGDDDGGTYADIDRTLAIMQVALEVIDSVDTSDDLITNDRKDRALWFTGIGLGGPAIMAATALMLNKIAIALIIGLGPIFILCLLFEPTRQLFHNWLLYGIGTLFSLALLTVLTTLALDAVIALGLAFWASSWLTGASQEGLTSMAMQQGGLGLLMTMLIVSAPWLAARLFRGTLGQFSAYSAFGGSGAGAGTASQTRTPADAAGAAPDTERPATHAFRLPDADALQGDEIKQRPQAHADSDFLVRHPEALASLGGGGPGEPLPKALHDVAEGTSVHTRSATDDELRQMQADIEQRRAQGRDVTTAQQALDELWTRQHVDPVRAGDAAPGAATPSPAEHLAQGIGWGVYSAEAIGAATATANVAMAQSAISPPGIVSEPRVYLGASEQVDAGLEAAGLAADGVAAVGRMGEIGMGVRIAPAPGVGAHYFVASGGTATVPAAAHAELYLGKGIRPDGLYTVGGTLDWSRAAPVAARVGVAAAWAGVGWEGWEVVTSDSPNAGDVGHLGTTFGMTAIGFTPWGAPVALTWAAVDLAAQSYHYTPVYATEYGDVEINGWRAMRATAIDNRERGIRLLMKERELSHDKAEELFDAKDLARRMELGPK